MNQTDPGQRIRELRKRHKLTQAQLAARVGISRHHMINIEKGGTASMAVYQRLADALQTSIAYLMASATSRVPFGSPLPWSAAALDDLATYIDVRDRSMVADADEPTNPLLLLLDPEAPADTVVNHLLSRARAIRALLREHRQYRSVLQLSPEHEDEAKVMIVDLEEAAENIAGMDAATIRELDVQSRREYRALRMSMKTVLAVAAELRPAEKGEP